MIGIGVDGDLAALSASKPPKFAGAESMHSGGAHCSVRSIGFGIQRSGFRFYRLYRFQGRLQLYKHNPTDSEVFPKNGRQVSSQMISSFVHTIWQDGGAGDDVDDGAICVR